MFLTGVQLAYVLFSETEQWLDDLVSNKWCFINKFREEHARIINTANS